MADTPTSSHSSARKRSIEEMEASHEGDPQPKLNNENEDILSPSVTVTSTEEHNNPFMSSAPRERQVSPAPSTLTSISVNTLSGPPTATGPGGVAPSAKRRKLTPQEKAEREEQKRKAAQEKEERREQREHERQLKAEETRKKNEEREEKKRQRDIEKQQKEQAAQEKKRQKELAQKQREEEALKKERQQSKLTNFFKPNGESPAKRKSTLADSARDRSLSVTTVDSVLGSPIKSSVPPVAAEPDAKAKPSEYFKLFLPYDLPANTTLPPKATGVECKIKLVDSDVFAQASEDGLPKLTEYTSQFKAKRGLSLKSLRTLFAELNASPKDPELVKKGELSYKVTQRPTLNILQDIRSHSIKYLYFDEDVRPPYCGTWSKEVSKETAHSVARNPCQKIIEVLKYDYDSEAEWTDEVEEGEDVNSDGEDEADGEDGADDMDGFLDNEDDTPNKSLIPKESVKWTGVIFEDASGVASVATAAAIQEDLMCYQVGSLIPEQMREFPHYSKQSKEKLELTFIGSANHSSVKPLSMIYWGGQDFPSSWSLKALPGRTPLTAKFDSLGNKRNSAGSTMKPSKQKPQPKTAKQVAAHMIAGRDLELLKHAIVGRTETKADLIPYVQKR